MSNLSKSKLFIKVAAYSLIPNSLGKYVYVGCLDPVKLIFGGPEGEGVVKKDMQNDEEKN